MAEPSASLTPTELVRYARHLTLHEVGLGGQQRLQQARVLLVGAGGLGSPAALYLAAAGVGTLIVVDSDVVDESNLQRQVLHSTASLGQPKVDSARERLLALNPHVQVITHQTRLTAENARELVRQSDLVVDGSDNFPTRYLVNDTCVLERRPLMFGSILRFDGQLSVFAAPGGPCYRCLFSEPPPPDLVPSCADAGVIGALPGIIGSMQALEAIKWIVGAGQSLVGRLLLFDGLAMTWREMRVMRDPACVVCGDNPTLTELIDYEQFCGAHPMTAANDAEISPAALAASVAAGDAPLILDVREPWEYQIAHIAGSQLIPLGELGARLADVPRGRALVTVCHHGVRSLSARRLLGGAGFGPVRSLEGGIDAWAVSVDRTMARY